MVIRYLKFGHASASIKFIVPFPKESGPLTAILLRDQITSKKYRGSGLVKWFEERARTCHLEDRRDNFRCNQAICDFADALYPDMNATTSQNSEITGHDGVFEITLSEVDAYVKQYNPVILRDSRSTNVLGHKAINIGVAKGSTYDRVLIFPTKPMKIYLKNRNPSAMTSVTRLYIAVTRARFSATFVV
jgi:DNA helicase-2/ATP-dependent DNA helicase PcrA